jgi:hypothetical protein
MSKLFDWLFPWRRKLRELQERSRQVDNELSLLKQRCDWSTERCSQALMQLDATVKEVRLHMPKATEAHLDMDVGAWHDMHDCTVILLGRWGNKDYVRIIPMQAAMFGDAVRYFRRFARDNDVRFCRIDAGIYSDHIRREVSHD